MSLGHDGILSLVINLLRIGISFVTLALLTRSFSTTVLGGYFYHISIITVVGSLSIIVIGEGLEKRLTEGTNRAVLYSTAMFTVVPIALVVLPLMVVTLEIIDPDIELNMVYLILGVVLTLLFSISRKTLNGVLKVPTSLFCLLLQNMVLLMLLVIFINLGPLYPSLPIKLYLVSLFASTMFANYKIKMRITLPRLKAIKNILSFSIFAGISNLSEQAYDRADILILGIYLSAASVGLYEVAWQTSLVAMIIPSTIGNAVRPRISYWWSNGQKQKASRIITKYLTFMITIILPIVMGGILLADNLLSVLFTSNYSGASIILSILLLEKIPQSIGGVYRGALFAFDRPKQIMYVGIVLLTSNIILNILFIPAFGIKGAAVATALSATLMATTGYYMMNKQLKTTVDSKILIWSCVSTAALGTGICLVKYIFNPNKILDLFILVVLGGVLYFLILLMNGQVRREISDTANLIGIFD